MSPAQLLPILLSIALPIFAVTMVVGAWWVFQLPRTVPHHLTPTSGHVKLSSVWIWIARATMAGQIATGMGLVAVALAEPGLLAPLIIIGCFIIMIGIVGVIWNSRPGEVEKHDIIWDDETISGPRSQNSTKRMTLRWDNLMRYNRTVYLFTRLEDHDGRTVFWAPFHLGYRAIDDAILRHRPDLVSSG